MEEFPKLLFLEVYGSLLLQGFLEVELDNGVEGLESRLFRDHTLIVVDLVFRHWSL